MKNDVGSYIFNCPSAYCYITSIVCLHYFYFILSCCQIHQHRVVIEIPSVLSYMFLAYPTKHCFAHNRPPVGSVTLVPATTQWYQSSVISLSATDTKEQSFSEWQLLKSGILWHKSACDLYLRFILTIKTKLME